MGALAQTQFRTPSVISDEGFKSAISVLETDRDIDGQSRLLPVAVCRAVVNRIDAEPKRTGREGATTLVALLLRCYPEFKAHDAQGYTNALFDLFSAYPLSLGQRVVDPVSGLPSRLKFSPKVPEVSEVLKAEVKRIELIRANALTHMAERERREDTRKAEWEFQRNRGTIEERREQVAKLLGPGRAIPRERRGFMPAESPKEPVQLHADDLRTSDDLRSPDGPISGELRQMIETSPA